MNFKLLTSLQKNNNGFPIFFYIRTTYYEPLVYIFSAFSRRQRNRIHMKSNKH